MWKRSKPISQMLACLEDEKTLLTSGDYTELSRDAKRKSDLLDALKDCKIAPSDLESLRSKAVQNGVLLQAAARALREVSSRMRSSARNGSNFSSYTASGVGYEVGGNSVQVSQKV